MLFQPSLLHVPVISKAFLPFHFLLSSRVLTRCSNVAQSLSSKAPFVTSTMAASGSTQQDETDMVLNFGKISIANDEKKKSRDYSARRGRRKQGRMEQHADPARPDETTPTGGQPSLNTIPNSRTRQVPSSKVQKISTQPAPNPFLSKWVTSADRSQGAPPPAISVGSEAALLKSPLASFSPSVSSATPSSETQRVQPGATQRTAPAPHAIYLSLASSPPMRLLIPQRLLIVLDLNGTLLFREVGSTGYKPRPFLVKFLDYCIENHVILIWSSAKPHNVDAVCKRLFTREQHQKLFGIWARDTLGLTPTQYDSKTQVYKQLDRIWADPTYAFNHPLVQQGFIWSQKNTLLVDDSILKASAQPYNHIEIPEFLKNSKEAKAKNGKDVLGQVTAYLEEARMWENVSSFVRETRFEIGGGWSWDWAKGTGRGTEREKGKKAQQLRPSGVMSGDSKEEEEGKAQFSDEDEGGGVKLTRN